MQLPTELEVAEFPGFAEVAALAHVPPLLFEVVEYQLPIDADLHWPLPIVPVASHILQATFEDEF